MCGPRLLRLREGGRKQKQENKKGARGPGLKTLTDLVQEGCNGRNGRNGRNRTQPGNMMVAEAILTSVGTPQLNPPGGSMVAEAILDLNFQRKCSSWASGSQNFACGACNGYLTVRIRSVFVFCGGGPGPQIGRAGAHSPRTQSRSAQRLRRVIQAPLQSADSMCGPACFAHRKGLAPAITALQTRRQTANLKPCSCRKVISSP